MSEKPSARFTAIFDSLPLDAQREILEDHLFPLLDLAPAASVDAAADAAESARQRLRELPTLDFKAKKQELTGLLNEIARDSKRATITEQSNREELIDEAIASLTDWLPNIWRTVFEFRTNFRLAHTCLLFCVEALDDILATRGGCKCVYMTMFLDLTFRDSSGVQKEWKLQGVHRLLEVLLWIWRDLLLSLLDLRKERYSALVDEIINDISEAIGWQALEGMLRGGRKAPSPFEEDPEFVDEDEDDDFDYIDCYDWTPPHGSPDVDEAPSMDEDEWADRCLCPLHGGHWNASLYILRPRLAKRVVASVLTTFASSPTEELHNFICDLSPSAATQEQLRTSLSRVATTTPHAFSAALRIYAVHHDSDSIVSLLRTHAHLARPCDSSSLQAAAIILGMYKPTRTQALEILGAELRATADALRVALRGSFAGLDDMAHMPDLKAALGLRVGSNTRESAVQRWVDRVATPGSGEPLPMALAAAMFMGVPLPPGLADDDDAGVLDIDEADADLEDLRDELRPKIKERWEGWTEASLAIEGGQAVLVKVYTSLTESMVWLCSSDIVQEMIAKIADKPSKHYLVDGLHALNAFCKKQSKALAQRKKKRKDAQSAKGNASGRAAPAPSSFAWSRNGPFTSQPHASTSASRSADSSATAWAQNVPSPDSPPPLEPITPSGSPPPLESISPSGSPPPLEPLPLYGGIEDVD